jgi:hypothetical protein
MSSRSAAPSRNVRSSSFLAMCSPHPTQCRA